MTWRGILVVVPLVALAGACGGGSSSGAGGGWMDDAGGPSGDDGGAGTGSDGSDGGGAVPPITCPAPPAVPVDAPAAACSAPGYGDDPVAWDGAALHALDGFYDLSTGRFGTAWWTAANALEAAETSFARTGGLLGGHFFVDTHAQLGADSAYINNFYDDEGWWANAWVHAYDITGDPAYLATAKSIFSDITTGWDATCGGGVWWSKDRTYKNAIPNELFLLLAASLHDRTPGDGGAGSYLEWAQKEWAWFDASGMENAAHLVNDGLTSACKNNAGTPWTYNQGVILAGLLELRRATRDGSLVGRAEAIADAAIQSLSDKNGILTEPCGSNCGGDAPQFKGIFTRSLEKLYAVDGKSAYRDFLAVNAHSLWMHARSPTDQLGLLWDAPFDSADVARHNSAEVTLGATAAISSTAAPLLRAAADPSFCHPLGAPEGSAAVSCDPASCPQPGFLQLGPGVTYLPAGAHTAHVRLSVDAVRPGACVLARLQVRSSSDAGTPLAEQDVAWSAFAAAGDGIDFALPYTVTTAGDAVEVRVYWFAQAGAPKLTVRDVAVDVPHAWTAANLAHDVGRLDGKGAWTADPVVDRAAGLLVHGPGTAELDAGAATAFFEMAVDDFSKRPGVIATLSVVDDATGQAVASRGVSQTDFPDALFHPVALDFSASAGARYDFDVAWAAAAGSPRLTVRGVYALQGARAPVTLSYDLRGIGTAPGDADLDGVGYALAASALPSPLPVGLRWYPLGPTTAGAPNVLTAQGQALTLPTGTFRAIRILALATNGTQMDQPFVLTYADGKTATRTRSISDWAATTTQADESVAWAMPQRWSQTGTGYGELHVYEYVLPVDAGETTTTLTLPSSPHVKLLAVMMDGSDGAR